MPISYLGKTFRDVTLESARANQYGPSIKRISNGTLVTFQYSFAKNDIYPLVILTRVTDKYFSGLNLHYLTFNDIKYILQRDKMNACNPLFSYPTVKPQKNLLKAFRRYKRIGIRTLKSLDCNLILNALGTARAIDPSEVEAIRENVKNQVAKLFNITAGDLLG